MAIDKAGSAPKPAPAPAPEPAAKPEPKAAPKPTPKPSKAVEATRTDGFDAKPSTPKPTDKPSAPKTSGIQREISAAPADKSELAVATSPRPVARPDSELAVATSPRPVARPESESDLAVATSPRPVARSFTPEVSPEVTPEVSPEVTPEVTPEVAPEVSPEVTPEVTPEVAPEVTPEVALTPMDEAGEIPKQIGNLFDVPHVGGDSTLGIGHDGTTSVRVGHKGSFPFSGPALQGTQDGSTITGQLHTGAFSNTGVTATLGPVKDDGTQRLSVAFQNQSGIQVGDMKAPGPVQVQHQTGVLGNLAFGVDVKPGDVGAIVRGEVPFPNPLDPSTLPVGSSLTARGEQFQSDQAGLTYRGAKLTAGLNQTDGMGTRIQRVNDDTVRVTVGPYDRTTNSVGLSVGHNGYKASLTGERQFLANEARSVDFDISTPEGRDAYNSFMQSGSIPTEVGPGVTNFEERRIISDERRATALAQVGTKLGVQFQARDGAQLMERRTPDGAEYTYQADWRGSPTNTTWRVDNDGNATFGQFSVPADTAMARSFSDRSTLRAEFDAAREQGREIVPDQFRMTFNEQGLRDFQSAFVSTERDRAVAGNGGYTDALRQMAQDPNVTNDQWQAAVSTELARDGSQMGLDVLGFPPLSRGLFQQHDSALGLANLISDRHMLGTTHEDLPSVMGRVRANIAGNPNIRFIPVTQ